MSDMITGPAAEPATAPSVPVPMMTGLAALAPRYDAFILDLWGTLHDGVAPLPGAVDALERLKAANKRVLILSNAPRRIGPVIARMRRLGITDGLTDAVLSSGEAAWLGLRDRPDDWHRGLGRACYLIGAAGDDSVISGLDLTRVGNIAEAEFIVCVGLAGPGETVADYEPVLTAAAARRLPMICANPDIEVLRGGVRELCAGALARRYRALGGDVREHGKPHAPIYRLALARLGGIAPTRVLAIGDSLTTDIAGAAAAGMDSLLVTGGIHAEALGLADLEPPNPDRLAALCAETGCWPSAAIAAFRW